MRSNNLRVRAFMFALAFVLTVPSFVAAAAMQVPNPLCAQEDVSFNPGNGEDIHVPPGFTVSVFKSGLNFPTGIAFLGNSHKFDIFVLESGHGLPSRCNDETKLPAQGNPFTPDVLRFDQSGKQIGGPLGKPTDPTSDTGGNLVLQPHGPAVDIAFEHGLHGGRLFATDSNQSLRTTGFNNSSRIVTVDITTGQVHPFITGLPTGDHPTEQLAFKGGWIYWSQGSTTNSGVVGLDNGGGANQPDIPCQDITLSQNTFHSQAVVSGKTVDSFTSGYSLFNHPNPGGTVKAFFNASTGHVRPGVCDGAILRAQLSDPDNIQAFSWGYRNGYAIRFAPEDHALKGGLMVGEDGADERGARPSNNAPDALHLAQQNKDGTPDYHGWPDRYGFLPSSQAVFNPVCGPGDDLPCALVLKEDVPIKDVLASPPQSITSPLAIEAADSSFTGIDFVPNSFAVTPIHRGAALYTLEGDFGFSKGNATPPAHEAGHEVKLVNFSKPGQPLELRIERFAHNTTFEQAFPVPPGQVAIRGFNRPTNVKFGPDGCAWVVDYGAVRDFGVSDPDAKFKVDGDGPLVQIPGTGVIWRIGPTAQAEDDKED
jgi:hypothetical protein